MKNNKLPEGLWPVMLSSFKEDKALDIHGINNLTEFYIRTGADGLFANCLSSEMFQLSDEERLTIIKTVVDAAGGSIPVVATGTFGPDLESTADFIKQVYDTGVAAVVINTNQLTGPDDDEELFKSNVDRILSETSEIPLGLYECPVPYKRLLSPSLMQWLSKTGRFLYHKDTSCSINAIEHKLVAVQNSSLSFYNAHVPTALKSLQRGAAGLSPIGANFYPELFSYLLKNYGDAAKAAEIVKVNDFLIEIDPLVHMNYPLSAKHFLKMRGLSIGETTRTPVDGLSSDNYLQLEQALLKFEQLAADIGEPLTSNSHQN